VSKVQRERVKSKVYKREGEGESPVSIKGREKGRGSIFQGTEVEGFQVQGSKEGGRKGEWVQVQGPEGGGGGGREGGGEVLKRERNSVASLPFSSGMKFNRSAGRRFCHPSVNFHPL
jgi:hypothetical protein